MPDPSYQPKVFRKQGGDELIVASGGVIDVESGGLLKVSGSALPSAISFAIAAGGANVSEVTITVQDNAGDTLAGARPLMIWLSDDAQGEGLTSTTASGTVQAKSASGSDLTALTAKKHLISVALVAGTYILEITDSAKTGFYVAVAVLGGVVSGVSSQLQTADYGS